ncbi:PAS domain S-box protein [Novosphingobium sp. 1949]|uniref:histidine kinase n=1 Tax=Novosphingobium organovorum TaxID=2930092 RepID=A0ABT0BAC2_9SPHN|nr:PAS domain S-box protein [Novosphingobium organovorum]MCJ2181997.1 PAS domain S-box protein [Novosphingobium organovorum]
MLGYVLATAGGSFALTRHDPSFAAFWPSNAGVLAAVLIGAPRYRVELVALASLVLFVTAALFGVDPIDNLVFVLANAIEITVACVLIEYSQERRVNLTNLRGLAQFLCACMGPAPMVSGALLALVALVRGEGRVLEHAAEWQVSHALGLIAIVPLVLSAYSTLVLRGRSRRTDPVELAFHALALAAVSVIVFAQPLALTYLVLPFVCLAVFRTGFLGAGLAALIVASISVALTLKGLGPIAAATADPAQRLMLVQLFIGSCVLTALPIAVVLGERDRLTSSVGASERRFRELAEAAPIGICAIDEANTITYANAGMAAMTGLPAASLLGQRIGRTLPDHQRRALDEALEVCRRGSGFADVALRVAAYQGGEDRWFQTRFAALSGQDGEVAAHIAVATDVTALHRSQQRLEQQERELRLLADNANDLICRIDQHGRIAYASQASERLFALPAGQLAGQSFLAHVVAVDRTFVGQAIAELGCGSNSETRTFRWHTGTGRDVWVEAAFRPIESPREARQFVVAVREISDRKAAQDALETTNTRLRHANHLLLVAEDLAAMGHWSFDAGAQRVEWSRTLAAMLGFDPEAPPGLAQVFGAIERRDAAGLRAALKRVLRKGGGFERRIRLREGLASSRVMEVHGNAQVASDGRITGLFGVCQDVTGRIEIEHELRKARDAAMSAAEARSRFIAVMSHEIRTPMTGVLATFAILARHKDAIAWPVADMPQLIATTQAQARALMVTLDNVLDYAKLEAGRQEVDGVEFDPNVTLGDAIDVFAARARAKGIGLDYSADVPFLVVGDPGRVQQVVSNLISNAVKFTETGQVEARCERLDAQRYRITVTDTGIGIAPEAIARVLQPFAQADARVARRFGGTGLGLAITRELLDLMGGTLSVESTPGEGSCFRVTLPIRAAGAPARDAPSAPASPSARAALPEGLRVLVIDDTDATRLAAQAQLGVLGCSVAGVPSGLDGVLRALDERFDVILVDSAMDGLDGEATIRLLRALPEGRGTVPILGYTAYSENVRRDALIAAGAFDIVPKPFTEAIVCEVIARACAAAPVGVGGEGAEEDDSFLAALPVEARAELLGHARADIARLGLAFARAASSQAPADEAGLARTVHALKGVAGSYGFERLDALCRVFETVRAYGEGVPVTLIEAFDRECAQAG